MPLSLRQRDPQAFHAGAVDYWRWMCAVGPRPLKKPDYELSQLLASPVDLPDFLAALRKVKQYVDPIHLATRPPYMSREGPQAEPFSSGYLALFEKIMKLSPAFTFMTYSETAKLFSPYYDLPVLSSASSYIQIRWLIEYQEMLRRLQRQFRVTLKEELIAAAMSPSRIAAQLEAGGFDALEN